MGIRTTLTLDEDVFERLKQESRARGVPFRKAVNEILRSGLLAERNSSIERRFEIEPRQMGTRPSLNYNDIHTLLEIGEGDGYR